MFQLNTPDVRPCLHRRPGSLPALAVALALAMSGGAQAMGDPLVDELPWVRPGAHGPVSSLTRAEVREALAEARHAGLLPIVGDAADHSDMQARRQVFHALQTADRLTPPDRFSPPRIAAASSAVAKELQAYVELRAAGAHPAMLRPSTDGTSFIDAEGRETLVVEIDD